MLKEKLKKEYPQEIIIDECLTSNGNKVDIARIAADKTISWFCTYDLGFTFSIVF